MLGRSMPFLATWGLSIVVVQMITIAFGRGTNFVQTQFTGPWPIAGVLIRSIV